MTARLRSATLLGAVLAFPACFGANPEAGPSPSDRVSHLGTALPHDSWRLLHYSAVVQDADRVYAFVEPAVYNVPVKDRVAALMAFDKKTGEAVTLMGTVPGSAFRLAVAGSDLFWVSQADCSVTTMPITGGTPRSFAVVSWKSKGTPTGACAAVDVQADADDLYVVVRTAEGTIADPFDPCCDANSSGIYSSTQIVRIPRAAPGAPVTIFPATDGGEGWLSCSRAKKCVWLRPGAAGAAFFFSELSDSGGSQLASVFRATKADGKYARVATLVSSAAAGDRPIPVGLAFSPTQLIWSQSSFSQKGPGTGPEGCRVYAVDSAAPAPSPKALYQDDTATCRDLVRDAAGYAYFTVLAHGQSTQSDGPQSDILSGIGIGRVPLAGGGPTVLPLARVDFAARRLEVDGDGLIVIDPHRIARVPISLFP